MDSNETILAIKAARKRLPVEVKELLQLFKDPFTSKNIIKTIFEFFGRILLITMQFIIILITLFTFILPVIEFIAGLIIVSPCLILLYLLIKYILGFVLR